MIEIGNNNLKIKESDLRLRLVITDKVESKIRWWCSKLPDKEWSGVLFYDYKGSFKKGNIVFTAVDFLVLDIGTSGHTEFVEDERIISYACSQGLVNQQVGIIHSHNRMAAFYSGEDTQTLIKEGSSRNHFLSLVVNNNGEYVAVITRRTKVKLSKITVSYRTFGNSDVTESLNNTFVDEFIEKINLDIVMPKCDNENIFSELVKSDVAKTGKDNPGGNKPYIKDYPVLFNDDSDIVDMGKIIQIYNRLATASLNSVPSDRKLKFDINLDDISNDDDDNEVIHNFIISQIENLSEKELIALYDMISELDSSTYVDMCLECINNNLEYYEY